VDRDLILFSASHLVAFLAGCLVTWYVIIRYFKVREVEGHTVLEVCHDEPPEDDCLDPEEE
jgi:hypothetical protein